MADVIKFMSRSEFVKSTASTIAKWETPVEKEKEPFSWIKSTCSTPKCDARQWMKQTETNLSEDDYVDVLEAIIEPEVYKTSQHEIQTIVDNYFILRSAGIL